MSARRGGSQIKHQEISQESFNSHCVVAYINGNIYNGKFVSALLDVALALLSLLYLLLFAACALCAVLPLCCPCAAVLCTAKTVRSGNTDVPYCGT